MLRSFSLSFDYSFEQRTIRKGESEFSGHRSFFRTSQSHFDGAPASDVKSPIFPNRPHVLHSRLHLFSALFADYFWRIARLVLVGKKMMMIARRFRESLFPHGQSLRPNADRRQTQSALEVRADLPTRWSP
jgi:hypothetical protein